MILQRVQQEPFIAALLRFCQQLNDFCFVTKNYPVYRILRKYISVYPELRFVEIQYDGISLHL